MKLLWTTICNIDDIPGQRLHIQVDAKFTVYPVLANLCGVSAGRRRPDAVLLTVEDIRNMLRSEDKLIPWLHQLARALT